ncbi:hypothetical protein OAO42_01655 [Candidatus Izimaplasma bacterium]|nr:hypothetical protein [Candidatus Izimaplasma bacterium]
MFKKRKDKKKLQEEFQLEDEIVISSPDNAKPLSKDDELEVTSSDIAKALNKKDKKSKRKDKDHKKEEIEEIVNIEEPVTEESKVELEKEEPVEEELVIEESKEDTTKEIDPDEVNDILARSIILQDIPEDEEEELPEVVEEQIEVVEEQEAVKETESIPPQNEVTTEEIQEEIEQDSIPLETVDKEPMMVVFEWYDNDAYKPTKADIKLKKQLDKIADSKPKKSKKGKKGKQEKQEPQKESIDFDEGNVSAKDLRSFFSEGEEFKRKLTRKEKKKVKKENKKQKRRSRRGREEEAIKDQKIFKFRKKKYNKVEDFIAYLNDHYLDIDQVATEVLKDKNFFGWISKRSGVFDVSLREFQEIKAKTEKE